MSQGISGLRDTLDKGLPLELNFSVFQLWSGCHTPSHGHQLLDEMGLGGSTSLQWNPPPSTGVRVHPMGAPLTRERHVSRPDVQHIIHATSDPVVPILIPAASVAGEVVAWVHFEICLLVPLVVAEHGAADASGNHPCQIEPFWVNKLHTF